MELEPQIDLYRYLGVLGKVQGADIPGVTEICAPFYSEAPREVFLRRFLEPSSCTIMGAGEIDTMLWCDCSAVDVGY